MKKTMYYVISCENVGPNAAPLNEIVEIRTEPGTTNMSHEARTSGWLGTTNDYASYAHGEYETLEDARAYIAATWPDYEPLEIDEYEALYSDVDLIARYGSTVEVWEVGDYLYDYRSDVITADTTDEEIQNLAEEAEKDAESEHVYIDGDIAEFFTEYRDKLREERE